MPARVHSASLIGIDAYAVEVEVDVYPGLPSIAVVGLPDNAVKESTARVKSAIINSGYPFPTRRITINLAPADLKKEGSGFDLPIALGILSALDLLVPGKLQDYMVVGSGDTILNWGSGDTILNWISRQRRFAVTSIPVSSFLQCTYYQKTHSTGTLN